MLLLLAVAMPAHAGAVLDRIKNSGRIVLAHRESSVPFSYSDADGKPVGYAMDLWVHYQQFRAPPEGRLHDSYQDAGGSVEQYKVVKRALSGRDRINQNTVASVGRRTSRANHPTGPRQVPRLRGQRH